jgi:predicted DNA-binding antitoxin AbrB/MazE fold protein
MIRQVDAVYEHGILRPLEPLTLVESQRVKLTITDADPGRGPRDEDFREWARAEVARHAARPIPRRSPGNFVKDP